MLFRSRIVQAALAGVPPVEVLFNVQAPALPLKPFEIPIAFVLELEVAVEVRLIVCVKQIELLDDDAVTEVGTGLTVKVLDAVAVPQDPPLVVNVKVTVPV